ncbi:hypothetical protein F5B21DRAFT_370770 [Xylaria acuta]|nr:hypothetical protein F5B21DRAFT_370770 [Xylaria acuta]
MQLLLDVIWSLPRIAHRHSLSLTIDFANVATKKDSMSWAGTRDLIFWYIRYLRRYIARDLSRPTRLSQLELSSRQLPRHQLNHSLNQALMLALAADRLSVVVRLRRIIRSLTRVTNEVAEVIKQLEPTNERVWLMSRLHPFMPVHLPIADRNVTESWPARQ